MIDFLKARAEIRRDLDEALDRLRQSMSAGEFGDSQSSIVKHPPTASLATIDADGVTSLADAENDPRRSPEDFFRANPMTQPNRRRTTRTRLRLASNQAILMCIGPKPYQSEPTRPVVG